MEICSWCADEDLQDEQLLMCDNCPRVFCIICVKKAYGTDGTDDFINHLISEENEPWYCPFCAPTPFLVTVRQLLVDKSQNVVMQKERDLYHNNESGGDDESVQRLIDKLAVLEEEFEEITKRMESPNMQQLRIEISKELSNEEEIEIELDLWKQKNLDRHANVSDSIGIIHDDLGKYRSTFCVNPQLKLSGF